LIAMCNIVESNILQNSRGFSLLEILFGMTVFMIGMLGVIALNISSLKSNTFSGNMSEAVIIAGDTIEELMAIDYDDADLDAGDHFEDKKGDFDVDLKPIPDGVPDPLGKNGIFAAYWNVVADQPLEKTKTVNVIVEWYVKDQKRTINISTIILDHD
jgi:hypothetical protein